MEVQSASSVIPLLSLHGMTADQMHARLEAFDGRQQFRSQNRRLIWGQTGNVKLLVIGVLLSYEPSSYLHTDMDNNTLSRQERGLGEEER